MKRAKSLKIISIILCGLFVFQQSGFAQVAALELDVVSYFTLTGNALSPDKFRPLHLRSVSFSIVNNKLGLVLDKGDAKDVSSQEIKDTTRDLLSYFLTGVTLPDNIFWVNLRPDSPDKIIDPLLAKTEVGRILLEADLQLKKDTAEATSPATSEGREYWDKLYKKAGEIYGSQNVSIPTLTRPWIVPDEIIIGESTGSAYIYKASLKVMLEQDYLKGDAVYSFGDPRQKQLNEYSSQLIREEILPKLTRRINNSRRYAALRQVYYSLILAQWFKARNQGKNVPYAGLINRMDLTNLQTPIPYSVDTYFNAYKDNFAKGQYNIKEPVYTPYGQSVRSYFSGGMILVPQDSQFARELAMPVGTAGNKAVLPVAPGMDRYDNLKIEVNAEDGLEIDDVKRQAEESESSIDEGIEDERFSKRDDFDFSGNPNLRVVNNSGEEIFIWELVVAQMMWFEAAVLVKHRNYLKSKLSSPPLVYYIGIGFPDNRKCDRGTGLMQMVGIDVAIPLIETDFGTLIGADRANFNFQEFQNGIRINLSRVYDPKTGKSVVDTLRFREFSEGKFEAVFVYKGVERKVIVYANRDLMKEDFIPEEIQGGFNVLTFNGAGYYATENTASEMLKLLIPGNGFIFIGSDDKELYSRRENSSEFKQSFNPNQGRNIWRYLKKAGHFSMQSIGVYSDYGGERSVWCVSKDDNSPKFVSRRDSSALSPTAPGGIDFRSLPIVTRSMDSLTASIQLMPRVGLQRIDLVKEWLDIEHLVNSGITPSAERLKEYFAASYVSGNLDSDAGKMLSCISDILRMEEQSCDSADPVLREMLVVLGSGSAKSLNLVFTS
ncbi:MAG: hypothetical protein PHV40_01575 [Candidatus Omnitrophica bacterium]|nr:hypothetical protein [Candidatus Omnitrophota bacterium]MDD5500904.1 hypothetical protein [Candidatus Omnitrophota bacterium]